ncbi:MULTISPECIES: cutinase family protein [Rhodococcus]|uniref:cutinase family protein n=1 Tax=Rhodococcus TaxID=1827 RepID=UPI00193B878D|nr:MULTISPECIES: cutinase family protein [Rhodococcus]QRI79227.1 cutinase family protein [Rhodococcus aetherivorans]QSE62411.1 cutinase family protein [Rhodococcus sp. PSBB066]
MQAAVGGLTVGLAAGLLPTLAAPAAQAAPPCKEYLALGIPGSNQGFDNAAEWKAAGYVLGDSAYGEQVADVLSALKSELPSMLSLPVFYPADGVDGIDPAAAKLTYNVSAYKISKDEGYAAAYRLLEDWARSCPSAKFFLVGYSQGAHIAADLAQTVFHQGSPLGRDRIAGVALIADPAYNGTSPGATEFVFTDDTLAKDPDHWQIHGSLGTRTEFDNSDPVLSICIYGDPICDNNSVGAGGYNAQAAADKAWMHTELYTDHTYADSTGLAEWLGKTIADRARN